MLPSQDVSEPIRLAPYEEMSSGDEEMFGESDCDSGMQLPSSDEWPASVLPGCSKGKDHKKLWTMSTSMMQGYHALKGPGTDTGDPLLGWFAKQDEINVAKGGAMGMLAGIEDSVKEQYVWKTHGPATFDEDDRQTVFQYRRPKVEHFTLDESFDSDHLEGIYENRDKEDDGWRDVSSYISDDEGGPEDGRISPCTFARWAEGTTRWDEPGDKHLSIWEDVNEYEIPSDRQRPPSPNTLQPRPRKHRNREFQVDEQDGGHISPACSEYARTEPSILWSPPPMLAKLPLDYYNRKLDRMDPELARALREGQMSTAASFGLGSADELDHPPDFSNTEVHKVIEKYWGADRTYQIIADKQRDIFYLSHNEEQVNASNERYRHKIHRLKHENRKLVDCLVVQDKVRERRILQHVDKHMRAMDFAAKSKLAEVKARYRENESLREDLSFKERVQRKLLSKLGKETAEQVFDMHPHVWHPLEYRKNRRNFS